ncbi:hypothetical protein CASFOL_031889 [Castilleja foliolosa]|uniref:Uncharacterized protein n=1 Tax=Castilleja foliolosa TaxID=1961234 RepID=A0ABD3C0T7_9LAMI
MKGSHLRLLVRHHRPPVATEEGLDKFSPSSDSNKMKGKINFISRAFAKYTVSYSKSSLPTVLVLPALSYFVV